MSTSLHSLCRGAMAMLLALPIVAAAPVLADTPAAPDEGVLGTVDGAQIYAQVCQGCHMPDGRGASGGGTYPALAGNANLASARFMATVVLHGRNNMPAFAPEKAAQAFYVPVSLTDVQVANVVNHVRTHFGNDYPDPITAAEVAELHPREKGE